MANEDLLFLDDVKDGEPIQNPYQVRGMGLLVEIKDSEVRVMTSQREPLPGVSLAVNDELSGRPINAETAHAAAQWLRDNVREVG